MLASPRLMVAMNLDDIPVQFHALGARATTFEGGAAFSLPFPEAVMRMQRREFYRLRIPPGENATCEIRREPSDPRPLLLPVHNISCGGIAMENWPDGQALETHRIYRNCRLNLGEEVHVVTDLEIVHSIDHVQIDGTRLRRCGARFVDMPGRVVTNIQRYVMQLERQLHADPEGTGET
jgi:c-di-GMP-binding flagellar brake protein YcgR